MRPRIVALLVLALGIVGLAVFVLLQGKPRAVEDDQRPAAVTSRERESVATHGRGNVAAGSHRDHAEVGLRGQILDPEGTPATGGSLSVYCLDTEAEGNLLSGQPIVVDAQGHFAGRGCRGRMCLVFDHPHLIQADPWIIEAGEDVTLIARPLARLEGRVVDGQGTPVPGARVRVVIAAEDEDPTALPPYVGARMGLHTDDEGRFALTRVERAPCDVCGEVSGRCDPDAHDALPSYLEVELLVQAKGFAPVTVPVHVERDRHVDITLVVADTPLRGELTDPNGLAYPRARVEARSLEREHERHRVDVDGTKFEIPDVGEGVYRLVATEDGRTLIDTEVRPGDPLRLVGHEPAGDIEVELRVLGPSNEPLADAVVRGGPFGGVRVRADGVVIASGVRPGSYRVRIVVGRATVRRQIDVPERSAHYAETIVVRADELL